MPKIDNARIVILATDGFEQSELEAPRDKLREAGAEVHVASLDGEPIRGWSGGNWSDPVEADHALADISVQDYDCLVIPGGQINPDLLRVNEEAVALVRDFAKAGKTVAAICHGPWLLIEAGIIDGREATSYHSIRTDMENAGAKWKDEDVVADTAIVTSRHPGDLDAFANKIIEEVEEGRHVKQAA